MKNLVIILLLVFAACHTAAAQAYTELACLRVGVACWPPANVSSFRTFADKPYDLGLLYQWNQAAAWVADAPAAGVAIPNWPVQNNSPEWATQNYPCPEGWRLPDTADFGALIRASVPVGGTWAEAGTRGNTVAGRFFGPFSDMCRLDSHYAGCVFLPAAGWRNADGKLMTQGMAGYYHVSMRPTDATRSYFFSFTDGQSSFMGANVPSSNRFAASVRCVR